MEEHLDRTKSSIEIALGVPHRGIFDRAILNVLSTDLAKLTYAQIIDGFPLASVARETVGNGLPDSHPLFDTHKELCPGVLEKTEEFWAQFYPGSLELDVNVSLIFPSYLQFKSRYIILYSSCSLLS